MIAINLQYVVRGNSCGFYDLQKKLYFQSFHFVSACHYHQKYTFHNDLFAHVRARKHEIIIQITLLVKYDLLQQI